MPTKVAAVQATPCFLDRDATVERTIALLEEAAAAGAELALFPETFVPGYPDWVWRTTPWSGVASKLYARLLDQAVEIPSPAVTAMAEAAKRTGAWAAVGIDERAGSTIYNTVVFLSPAGEVAAVHRKLMPTGGERLVWGSGDGSGLVTVDTAFGRVGALICWESYMPLARAAMYAKGIDVYLAPTWDNSDTWTASMRHIAKEGRVHVVSTNSLLRGSDVPAELGAGDIYGGEDDWMSRGNACIVGPGGDLLAGPLVGEPGILYADIDVDAARAQRQQFDPVGHYARPDVLRLVVDDGVKAAVAFTSDGQPVGQSGGIESSEPARSGGSHAPST